MSAEHDPYAGLDPDAAGRRIGELFDDLASSLPPDAWDRVAELTGLLSSVHGAALARMLARAATLADGQQVVAALTSDPLVASLLVVHDLRPPAAVVAQPVRLVPRGTPPS